MRLKKILANFLILLIGVGLTCLIYIAYQFVTIRLSNFTTDVPRTDCLVVLGAAVWEGGRPSPVFGDRLARAAELYHAGFSRKIIVSGGLGKHPPAEAEAGRIFLLDSGVADADIILEMSGMTTSEQAARVREICERENFQTVALVTSFFHERRAMQIFSNAGLKSVAGARTTHTRFQDINRWVGREAAALAVMNWWIWTFGGIILGLLFVWLGAGRRIFGYNRAAR